MSNLINSTVLQMNDFPGHAGRPGAVGGSLPRKGAGAGLAAQYQEFRNSPKTKKAFDAYFKKGAEEYAYEGKYKSRSIEDTISHSLYETFDSYLHGTKHSGPRAKAFEKLQEDLDVKLQMPKTCYDIMMKSMHLGTPLNIIFLETARKFSFIMLLPVV